MGQTGASAGSNAVAFSNYYAEVENGPSTGQWKVEGEKIISLISGMALDIKNGSIWSNKDIILWPASESKGIDSQSWRMVLYQD